MKTIVMAEKPSVGKELGRILGCGKKTKGYWEGKDYIVTWAMGHLVELADPAVRQTLLDLFQAGTVQEWEQIKQVVPEQSLSYILRECQEERNAIIWTLHEWAAEIGPERALRLVGDAVRARAGEPFDLERLFADLERSSGASLVERWRALLPGAAPGGTRINTDEHR